MKTPCTLAAENVRRAFGYHAETGELIWNNFPGCHTVGKIAGTLNSHGYIMIGLNRKIYPAHRLVWFWHHGSWPKYPIRHKSGNRADNRISNLVEVLPMPPKAPAARKPPKEFTGVQDCGNYFRARITRPDGKLIHLGNYRTREAARDGYRAKHIELFGSSSPYFAKLIQ